MSSTRGATFDRLLFSRDSVSSCVSSSKGAILESLLLSRDNVVSCVSPVSGSIVDRLFPSNLKAVRFVAYSKPVRLLMLALLAVSDVNVSISAAVIDASVGLPRVSAIFAVRSVSGSCTNEVGRIAFTVNCIGCEIFAAVARMVVSPSVCPNVKRTFARPFVSVVVVRVLSFPLPLVIEKVIGTSANARFH